MIEQITFMKSKVGGYHVLRDEIGIGRVEQVSIDNSNPRARAYSRMGWKAVTRGGKVLGTFDTRKEAAEEISKIVTFGLAKPEAIN